MKPHRTLALTVAGLAVSGCNGAGSFDDFFELQGFGSTETYIALVRSATFDEVGSELFVNDDESTEIGDATLELGLFGNVDSLDIDSTESAILFDEALGDTITETGEFIDAEIDEPDFAAVGRFGNPAFLGLSYHTFGAWASVNSFGDGELGAVVLGELTPVADVPTTGGATYTGQSTGVFISEVDDDILLTQSDITADVDFGAGSIDFSSFNTETGPDFDGPFVSEPDLNASGTLAIAGNVFDGAITTTGGLVGTADGVFAGPEAEELGGTMYAGDADEAYIAGFGASR